MMTRRVTRIGRGIAGAAALAAMGAGATAQSGDLAYVGTSMFGDQEVGGGGAPDPASGDFNAELDLANGRICYMLEVYELDDFAAAHVHQGAPGSNGPPVITLELMGEDGDDVCQDVDPEVLKKIARRPGSYYVNVHTAEFPAGAVRGQLGE